MQAAQPDKSARVEYSRRPLWQGLGPLMALEIPQKQNEKENHNEHENSEVVSCGIRTAPLGA